MPEEEPKQKVIVIMNGQATQMSLDELTSTIAAPAKFPNLCNEFGRAAMVGMRARLHHLISTGTAEEVAEIRKAAKIINNMQLKHLFHMAAVALTPNIGGLKHAALERFQNYHFRCFDRIAGIASDTLGPHRASQNIPVQMRSENFARLSDELDMKNMSSLIRRAIALN